MVWLPNWLARRINPISFLIDDFIAAAASEISPGSVVLDAGAGECRYAALFSHCTYISVDFAKGDPQWDYKHLSVVGNLLSLPIKNNSVDVVICTQTLEHVNEPAILLKEVSRAMKPNGQMYLTAPFGSPIHQPPYDFFRYTHYGLEHLLRKSGFNIESIQPQGGYFLYLACCLLHMHRLLFPLGRPFHKRLILFPFQFLVAIFATILGPLALYVLDNFDKKRSFTLNYACKCQKA
jgi:SAM-dependent methyltransferase